MFTIVCCISEEKFCLEPLLDNLKFPLAADSGTLGDDDIDFCSAPPVRAAESCGRVPVLAPERRRHVRHLRPAEGQEHPGVVLQPGLPLLFHLTVHLHGAVALHRPHHRLVWNRQGALNLKEWDMLKIYLVNHVFFYCFSNATIWRRCRWRTCRSFWEKSWMVLIRWRATEQSLGTASQCSAAVDGVFRTHALIRCNDDANWEAGSSALQTQ